MRALYLTSVFLHVISATIWIGGSAFLAFVLRPALKRLPDREAAAFLGTAARRFRTIGWAALGTLVATGAANLGFRGIGPGDLASGSAFRGSAGHALACKLALVAILIGLSALHDFRLGPQALRLRGTGSAEDADRARKRAGRAGRLVFLIGLAAAAAAVAFVRGGL